MKKPAISQLLADNHLVFQAYLDQLNAEEYTYQPAGKWSAGQQQEHIRRSVQSLTQGLLLPKFALQRLFGEANRPSKTFDELVDKYKAKLTLGGTASGRYVPPPVRFVQRAKIGRALQQSVARLNRRLQPYSEADLDHIILPHPLLGKVTMREMLYFTAHHVRHHQANIQRQLAERES